MKSWLKIAVAVIAFIFVFFIVTGYLWSDDVYFRKIILENNITSPEKAFEYVVGNTIAKVDDIINPEYNTFPRHYTPRFLLTKVKVVSCDEGAILVATLSHLLGFKTRLVDIYADDGKNSHTALEIYENNAWKLYDTSKNISGVTYQESIRDFKADKIVYRKYPKLYNRLVQSNYFLKKIALLLRGIPG